MMSFHFIFMGIIASGLASPLSFPVTATPDLNIPPVGNEDRQTILQELGINATETEPSSNGTAGGSSSSGGGLKGLLRRIQNADRGLPDETTTNDNYKEFLIILVETMIYSWKELGREPDDIPDYPGLDFEARERILNTLGIDFPGPQTGTDDQSLPIGDEEEQIILKAIGINVTEDGTDQTRSYFNLTEYLTIVLSDITYLEIIEIQLPNSSSDLGFSNLGDKNIQRILQIIGIDFPGGNEAKSLKLLQEYILNSTTDRSVTTETNSGFNLTVDILGGRRIYNESTDKLFKNVLSTAVFFVGGFSIYFYDNNTEEYLGFPLNYQKNK